MVLILAHRGYSGKYPENTLLALKKAAEAGADGVEFDVRTTKDSKLVVFHDNDLKHLCKKKGKLSDKRYSELKDYTVDGQKIPLLTEVLEYLKTTDMKLINIEAKVQGHEEEMLEVIYKYGMEDKVLISTFNYKVLEKLRSLDPEIKLGYAVDNRPDRVRRIGKLHKKIKLYSVNPFHNRTISTGRFIRDYKKMGLVVIPWFRRDFSKFQRFSQLKKMGVDGMIVDYPAEVKEFLKNGN
jgi:glycerophosphoryl diester phosphodiesterase